MTEKAPVSADAEQPGGDGSAKANEAATPTVHREAPANADRVRRERLEMASPGTLPYTRSEEDEQDADEVTAEPEGGMHAHGYFRVVRHVPEGAKAPDDNLAFHVYASDVPDEVLSLKTEIERTLTVLKMLYLSDRLGAKRPSGRQHFEDAFAKLLGLAQVGLGEIAAPKVARAALNSLREEIVEREAGLIKNRYMIKLGRYAAVLGLVAISARLFLLPYVPGDIIGDYMNTSMITAGCCLGVWLSFGARKVVLQFSDLIRLEDDQLDPGIRLVFTAFLTHVLALMVGNGVLDLSVGGFSASAFAENGAAAFLFGAVCGLSEKALPSALTSRASAILEGVSKR